MPNLNAHLIKLKKIKVRSTAQIQHQLNSIEMINLAFKFTRIPFAIIHNNVVVFILSLSYLPLQAFTDSFCWLYKWQLFNFDLEQSYVYSHHFIQN